MQAVPCGKRYKKAKKAAEEANEAHTLASLLVHQKTLSIAFLFVVVYLVSHPTSYEAEEGERL